MTPRVGQGIDVHAFGGNGPITLLGVSIESSRGLVGTSDADVAAHAVADALLGAAALGDLGGHFPSSDPSWQDADSMQLLEAVVFLLAEAGFAPLNVDVTIVVQSVRLAPFREQMRTSLADILGIDVSAVSVKATTTDGLGLIGRNEGAAAFAVAILGERSRDF